MTYNILDGGRGRIDPIAEVIRHVGADVVACPEADSAEDFATLAKRLGMHAYWAEAPHRHAVGMLSRFPITLSANRGGPHMARTCAEIHVHLGDGCDMVVFGLHLTPHISLEREAIRVEEIQRVLEVAGEHRTAGRPHVIMGDFNATHPNQKVDFEMMRQADQKRLAAQDRMVPTRTIEAVLAAGYIDAYDALHGSDEGLTLSTSQPSLRVDYIFLSPDLAGRLRACDVRRERLATYASDHFPVWADVDLP